MALCRQSRLYMGSCQIPDESQHENRVCCGNGGTGAMVVAQIMEKMIAFSNGDIHDIDHLIRVWTYAKTIGELESLDQQTQEVLEIAAITHDIACPLCREKYGNTNGRHQDTEGALMVRDFLTGTGMTERQVDRVSFLVGHHHTLTGIDGMDHQILVEADYIANAAENGYSKENITNFMAGIMKTQSGKRLLAAVSGLWSTFSGFGR